LFQSWLMEDVTLNPAMPVRLVWRWEASGVYSTSSVYNALFLGQHSVAGGTELWTLKAPNKSRFFHLAGAAGSLLD
jgi:hypothetical protein